MVLNGNLSPFSTPHRSMPDLMADFAEGAGHPPRLFQEGKPELTKATWSATTMAAGIPEGFRSAKPGGVAPRGAEALSSGMSFILHSTTGS